MHEGVAVTGPQDPPAEAPEDALTEELPEAAARPEVLVVDDIELRPRWYEEQVDGEGLVIETIVEVEAEARRRLHALFGGAGYFPVVRRGLSDAPVEMRFGMTGWSERASMTTVLKCAFSCRSCPGRSAAVRNFPGR